MQQQARQRKTRGAEFIPVVDSRNRKLPGIYTRNGRYYGQLWVDREDGTKTARKFPLLDAEGQPVKTMPAAKEAMEVLRHSRRERKLPLGGPKPTFFTYVDTYFSKAEVAAKKKGTLDNERWNLERWKEHLGDIRLDRIDARHIAALRDKRLRAGSSNRTVNLDQIALRNVLK